MAKRSQVLVVKALVSPYQGTAHEINTFGGKVVTWSYTIKNKGVVFEKNPLELLPLCVVFCCCNKTMEMGEERKESERRVG